MFTASELSTMRHAARAAMPDTFRVDVPGAKVEDGAGGVYYGSPTPRDIPCRKAPIGNSPQERLLAEQIQEVGLEVIVLPWDAEVSLSAEGTWIHGESGRTKRYQVKAIPERTYQVERRVLVTPGV